MKSCITISLVEEARGGPFVLWDDLSSSIRTAATLGFDAVEIFPPGPEAIAIEPLRKLLSDHQLKLAAVGTGAGWVKHRWQLADADASIRQRALSFVRSIIDIAGPLGAATIIGSMQGRHDAAVPQATALGYLRDSLQSLGEHAEQYGAQVFYEPLNRYETNQVNTVAAGVALLNSLGVTNVLLLCDLFHMNIEESSTPAALTAAGSRLGHIHFVDSNRRPVGAGQIAFGPIMEALRAIPYSGYLSAEAFAYPTPLLAAEQTIRAFRYWTHSTRNMLS